MQTPMDPGKVYHAYERYSTKEDNYKCDVYANEPYM